MLLGMVSYKPHFGFLAPVALAAGGHWRAFWAALATITVLVGISVALFGPETWVAYFAAFATSPEIYQSGQISFAGMVTPLGAARLLGFSPGFAYAVQATSALLMAGLTALIWRRCMSRPLRAASLLAATLLASPLVLIYDELLALVALGWLVREARKDGFLPWEKVLLLATYPLALMTWTAGTVWYVPLGPFVSVTILALCLRRVWRASTELDRLKRAGSSITAV